MHCTVLWQEFSEHLSGLSAETRTLLGGRGQARGQRENFTGGRGRGVREKTGAMARRQLGQMVGPLLKKVVKKVITRLFCVNGTLPTLSY